MHYLVSVFMFMASLAAPALASDSPLPVASAAGGDSTPLFVAADEGIFVKHGLTVKPILIPLMPNIVPAIVSGSVRIGSMTATTFLQAVAGGVDLVAVAGGSVTSPDSGHIAFLARENSGIHGPRDLIGRRVGMPGLGAFMHVTFCYWLTQQGVDFRKVNFVETTLSSMGDQLRSGTVDAVGAVDPYAKQIAETGAGYVVSLFLKDVPAGKPIVLYVASRDWVKNHTAELAAFRAGIVEADALTHDPQNADRVRSDLGHYVKLPPEILRTIDFGVHDPTLRPAQLDWWVEVMSAQGLLQDRPDGAKLIQP